MGCGSRSIKERIRRTGFSVDSERLGNRMNLMKAIKIVVERHPDGYVAYPLGTRGVVVGEGDSYKEAVENLESALKFHVETFGAKSLEGDAPVLEAFVAETGIPA